jgi:hypothetical protein
MIIKLYTNLAVSMLACMLIIGSCMCSNPYNAVWDKHA